MKKKILTWVLLLALVVSILPTAAFAAVDTNYGMKLTGVDSSDGTKLLMTLAIKGPACSFENGKASIAIKIDSTKLKPVRSNGNALSIGSTGFGTIAGGCTNLDAADQNYLLTAAALGREDAANNIIYYALQPQFNGTAALNDYTDLVRITLAYQNGATKDSLDMTSIQLVTKEESYDLGQDNIAYVSAVTPSTGFQYGINARGGGEENLAQPTITYPNSDKTVSIDPTGLTVSLGSSTLAVPTAVQKTATTTASVTYTPNNATAPSDLKYSIDPAYAGVSIDASTGAITVSPNAAKGTVTVKAASASKSISNTASLTLTKADPAATTVTLNPKTFSAHGKVPQAGATNSYGLSASITDQYGQAFTDTIDWEVPTGITYNATTQKIDVTDAVAVGANTITAKAHSDADKKATITLTVDKGDGPAAPTGLSATDAATKGGKGKLNGTTAAMEYNTNRTATSGWTACTAGSTEVPMGNYYVRYAATAKYNAGAATTTPLSVGQPGTSATPVVTITPANPQISEDVTSVTLTASVSGANGTLAYQWQKDGTNIPGATQNTYAATEIGTYTCVVTHTDGNNDPAEGTGSVTVTMKQAAMYTVTFDADNGTEPKTVQVKEGEKVAAGDIPTAEKTGYTFKGWTPDPATTTITKDTTFTAQYEINKYNVTFKAGENGKLDDADEDGKVVVSVEYGKAPAAPKVTANEGYEFAKWVDKDGKDVDLSRLAVTSDGYEFTAVFEEAKVGYDGPYVKGKDDNMFCPNDKITRGEVAIMMARLSKGFDSEETYTGTIEGWDDVDWAKNEVAFCEANNILKGMDGNMQPGAKITRAQFATMLVRVLGLETEETAKVKLDDSLFEDVKTSSSGFWAVGYINILKEEKITEGYEDGSFQADNEITRAEVVTMINRAFEIASAEKGDEFKINFKDVNESDWHWEYIMPAANTLVKDILK